jgi:hypothetical protein
MAIYGRQPRQSMAGYLKFARALTIDQWQAESQKGFLLKFLDNVQDTFWKREPMSSIGERLRLELPGDSDMCSLHNVSISEDRCSLFFSFEYGVFTERYARLDELDEEPVERSVDGEQGYYLLDVSLMLHIDDELVVSSEVLDICSQTSDE